MPGHYSRWWGPFSSGSVIQIRLSTDRKSTRLNSTRRSSDLLANREKVDPQLMHIGADAWTLLALVGAILFWISYPNSPKYRSEEHTSELHTTLFRSSGKPRESRSAIDAHWC